MSDQPYGRPTTLPGLGSVPSRAEDIPKWLGGVKETLEVWTGARGSKFDSVVTWRDLASMGIITGDFRGARFSTGRPTGAIGAGGVLIQNGNGTYVQVSVEEFAEKIKNTGLYRDLNKRLNDPTRFDALPAAIRDILLKDIAAEARERGADIRRLETKVQEAGRSMAVLREEVTAAVDTAVAGVRTTAFAYAEPGRAAAGIATQVTARLDDVNGTGVTLEEVMYGTAGYDGVMGQYTVKIDANGALAGFGLTATNYDGVPDSAFIVRADRFAIVSPTYTGGMTLSPSSSLIPFGVDASGVYINGTVRINASGTTLDDLASDVGVNIASTSEWFKVNSAGTAVNTTITLTASLQGGLTGTVTWTASAGWTGTPPTGTNTWTINAADQSADAVTYTATKVDGANTYTDSFTIVRLRDGSDALTAILTNESHGVPANFDGTSPVFTGAGGTMKVYRGTTLLTSGVTFALKTGGNASGLTQSINSSSGLYSVTAAGSWAAGSAVATIAYEATVGSTVLEKVFTLTKNLQGTGGTAGTPAQFIRALPNTLVFRIAKDGTSTPSSVAVTTTLQGISGTITWTTPDVPGHALNGQTGSGKTIYPRSVDPSPNLGAANSLKVVATCAGFSDTFTLVKVFEGSDAVTATLSNESHTVPTAADGSLPNFTGASCRMSVFIGANDDSTNWSYLTSVTNVTITGTNTRDVAITGLSADVGYVDITASKATYSSITKRFTVTRAKQGITGTGTAGTRGNRQLYLTSPSYTAGFGAAAYKSAATSAIATATSGSTPTTPINGDTVTFTDGLTYTTTYTYKLTPSPDWYLPGVVIDGSLLVTGSVAATAITAGTLTGHTIQTAASGARVIMKDTAGGYSSAITGYDSSNTLRLVINASVGTIGAISNSTILAAVTGNSTSGIVPGVAGAAVAGPAFFGSSTSGYGLQIVNNTTRAPMSLGVKNTIPTAGNSVAGDVMVYSVGAGTWLCWYDGAAWYKITGITAL